MIVVTFLNRCGSDRRCLHVTVSNKDVELAESVHFARLLNRLLALREMIYDVLALKFYVYPSILKRVRGWRVS